MTYRELIDILQNNPEQLDNDVTIYDQREDEYYPMDNIDKCYDGILDDGHIVIVF